MPARTRSELLAELRALHRRRHDRGQALTRQEARLNGVRRTVSRKRKRRPGADASSSTFRDLCRWLLTPEADLALQLTGAGVIRSASAGARAMLGVQPRDLSGRLVYDCVAE